MDFLRIRQKAKERAHAQSGPDAPAAPPPAEPPAPPPAATSAPPAPAPAPPPVPATAIAAGPTTTLPAVLPGVLPAGHPTTQAAAPPTHATPASPPELPRLEDALRVELAAGAEPARRGAAVDEPGEPDPLDEFFWREDETAPRLPDLVAASELPVAEPPPARREWLTFRLGAEDYGLEIEHVREVLKPPPLTAVPRAPDHILGVIMVRGDVIAVVDPRIRLGLPRGEPDPRARVLVCDTGEESCGVLVDSVSHVIRLTASSIEPRPPGVGGVSAEYIVGIGRERNRLVILLDAPSLLGDTTAAVRAPGVLP